MADWEEGMNLLGNLLGKPRISTKAELKSNIGVWMEKMCLFFIPNLDSRRYSQQHQRFPGFCSFCTRGRWGCTQGGCAVAVCTCLGPRDKSIAVGLKFGSSVFFPFFLGCLLIGSCFFGTICQCRGEIIVHTADKRRDIIWLPFTLLSRWFSLRSRFKHPAVLFVFFRSSCLFYSNNPIFLSSFYLMTPLFSHSSTVCLRWPHLPPLILFIPLLTFSLSPLPLSFITYICPSSVYFVLKFNNFFTPFLLPAPFF